MLQTLALLVVVLTGLFLVGLAALLLFAPARAVRFLDGFVSSLAAHLLEMLLRVIAGAGFLLHAPSSRFPDIYTGIGWLLLLTTLALLLIPWRWHQRFARTAVPMATRYAKLLGLASALLGAAVLWSTGV